MKHFFFFIFFIFLFNSSVLAMEEDANGDHARLRLSEKEDEKLKEEDKILLENIQLNNYIHWESTGTYRPYIIGTLKVGMCFALLATFADIVLTKNKLILPKVFHAASILSPIFMGIFTKTTPFFPFGFKQKKAYNITAFGAGATLKILNFFL